MISKYTRSRIKELRDKINVKLFEAKEPQLEAEKKLHISYLQTLLLEIEDKLILLGEMIELFGHEHEVDLSACALGEVDSGEVGRDKKRSDK